MEAPAREDDRRAGRWMRTAIFVVFVLVLGAAGFLIFKAFVGAHLIGSTD